MKVYLDYIFVQNLIIDFVLLKETSYITKNSIKTKNAVIASLIASIYVVILIWFKIQEFNYFVSKILLAFLVIYICFKPKKATKYIKLVMFFLIVSAINIGTFTIISNLIGIKTNKLTIQISFYILGLILSRLVIKKVWELYKREIKNEDLIYDVRFNVGKKEYKFNAFLDTGNNVYSYLKNLPILFAEKPKDMFFENELSKLDRFEIQTTTLSKSSVKKAYVIENITISKNEFMITTKAGIVFENSKFSNKGDYNMILNYCLYTEKMGGIKI